MAAVTATWPPLLAVLLLAALPPSSQRTSKSDIIKRWLVDNVYFDKPGLAPTAIRLMFHDCWGPGGKS